MLIHSCICLFIVSVNPCFSFFVCVSESDSMLWTIQSSFSRVKHIGSLWMVVNIRSTYLWVQTWALCLIIAGSHTQLRLTLNSFFVGSLRISFISEPLFFQSWVQIKWRGTSVKTGFFSSFCCDCQHLFASPHKTLCNSRIYLLWSFIEISSLDHNLKCLHPLQGTNLSTVKLPIDENQI